MFFKAETGSNDLSKLKVDCEENLHFFVCLFVFVSISPPPPRKPQPRSCSVCSCGRVFKTIRKRNIPLSREIKKATPMTQRMWGRPPWDCLFYLSALPENDHGTAQRYNRLGHDGHSGLQVGRLRRRGPQEIRVAGKLWKCEMENGVPKYCIWTEKSPGSL